MQATTKAGLLNFLQMQAPKYFTLQTAETPPGKVVSANEPLVQRLSALVLSSRRLEKPPLLYPTHAEQEGVVNLEVPARANMQRGKTMSRT